MYTVKQKSNFRTLSGVLVFMMLIMPEAVYARGGRGGGGGGGERMASSGRGQMSAPAERGRSMGSERMNSAPSRSFAAPQQRSEVSNWRGRSEGFSNSRQFSAPQMRFDRPQQRVERSTNNGMGANQRFWSNNNRAQRENFSNRVLTRTEPTIGQTFNRNVMRSETGNRGHDSIGTWRRESSQMGRGTQSPANVGNATRTETFRHNRGDNESRVFGRDTHAQAAPEWNRDHTSTRVVDNVPASISTQRNSFWGGSRFSHHDGHRFVNTHHNDFMFYGRDHHHGHHHFASHWIIWPDFFYLSYFNYGPWYTYYPVYPYYHRGYVFVNPCGYWPYGYNYLRYYWYGSYPYYWYGYNPVPYEYGNDNYNYYTYNYYGDTTGPADSSAISSMSNYTPQQPAPETSADQYFDEGVKAFGANDYTTAVAKFALASQTATDDKVLPFAYSQAFLATGDYKSAAQVLRAALAKVAPVTEGVFYPRGLYSSDDILLKQVDDLSVKANQNPQDTDLQLLVGYQYLGLGELDKAAAPLKNASADSLNGPSANALLQLLNKLQTTQAEAQTQTPAPQESN